MNARRAQLILIASLCLFVDQAFGQLRMGGSFIIMAVCKDGIVAASDTRSMFASLSNPTPMSYYDGDAKIHPFGKNAIGSTGQGSIGDTNFSVFFDAFRLNHSKTEIDKLLPEFLSFCEQTFPEWIASEIKKIQLFAAGYKGNTPYLCYYNANQTKGPQYGCANSGILQSDAASRISDSEDRLPTLSATQAADLAQVAIEEYANRGDNWKIIGGKTSVLLITPTGPEWMRNKPAPRAWIKFSELAEAHNQGKVILKPLPPFSEEAVQRLLSRFSQ